MIKEIDVKKILMLSSKLNNLLDGFDEFYLSKKTNLTIKDKVLVFLLDKNLSPFELIKLLGIAKSNLANLSKTLISEGVIDSYKSMGNYRNIFYRITEKGLNELNAYKVSLYKVFGEKFENNLSEIGFHIEKILEILKGV